jgi:hypothetical protein
LLGVAAAVVAVAAGSDVPVVLSEALDVAGFAGAATGVLRDVVFGAMAAVAAMTAVDAASVAAVAAVGVAAGLTGVATAPLAAA